MSEHPYRRKADRCPACDSLWDECICPELVREAGGVVRAEPAPGTWEQFLLIKRGEETGMLPEDKALRAMIKTELEESATLTQPMDPQDDQPVKQWWPILFDDMPWDDED